MADVNQTNPLPPDYHETVTNRITGSADWTTPGLKIIRLRLLSDPGYPRWDVSYCHGQLPDGRFVNVGLPFGHLSKNLPIRMQLLVWARKEKLFLKPTGIFDAISTLN